MGNTEKSYFTKQEKTKDHHYIAKMGGSLMANRPLNLGDYIGQEKIKLQLKITIGASLKNDRSMPHMLLYGNPGLGKTTLAKIIANEIGVGFHEVLASNLKTVEDIENVLAGLSDERPDVLFIDEVHRLTLKTEELFYPVMEDFEFEREINDGYRGKKVQRFWVPRFTLMGATTLAGELSRPLRDRFGLHFQLQNYELEEVAKIISNLADREYVQINDGALYDIARRSKGVARIAINYFYRCKEYADFINGDGNINDDVTHAQFDIMGIDEMGLDDHDYSVLKYLSNQPKPVGLSALATACDIDQPTIQNIIEPFLVQTGMINRTRSGREITENGFKWINRSI
jgi:Holliday junction DNA helicase RuvB